MVKQIPSEEASIHDEINIHELPATEFMEAFMEEIKPFLQENATLPSIERIDRTIQGLERFAQVYAARSRHSIDSDMLIWIGEVESKLLPNLLSFMEMQMNTWKVGIHDLRQNVTTATVLDQSKMYARLNEISELRSYMKILMYSGAAVHKYFHRLTHI